MGIQGMGAESLQLMTRCLETVERGKPAAPRFHSAHVGQPDYVAGKEDARPSVPILAGFHHLRLINLSFQLHVLRRRTHLAGLSAIFLQSVRSFTH